MESNLIKKYRSEFLGSILILKINDKHQLILENRTFRIEQTPLRLIKPEYRHLSIIEQYKLIKSSAMSGLNALDAVTIIKWIELLKA